MRVAALVLAAGRGTRLGHALPKAFVPLAGRPLVLHSLDTLAAVPEIELVVPVVAAEDRALWDALAADAGRSPKMGAPVAGGAERQDSVRAGMDALPAEIELVAVHDAARPAVTAAAVQRVIAAAACDGAALLATPVSDTIKRARDGRVLETPPRDECWAAQTPQVFRVELLRRALQEAKAEGRTGTDDAQLVEWLGVAVTVVCGDVENRKVTHPDDLAAVERTLRAREARG